MSALSGSGSSSTSSSGRKIAIVIPARYGSSRFPGKPLAQIAGKSMLERVLAVAENVRAGREDVSILVTSENAEIAAHARALGATCILTPEACATGSDRVLAALEQMSEEQRPEFVINLQGDAPFTPPLVLEALIEAYESGAAFDVVTPVHRLDWADLDRLRLAKEDTPFSGTTAVMDASGRALWFSKMIIPAIRGEEALRADEAFSPVYQHMGVYGFRLEALTRFCVLPHGTYETLEGLEQLRMLEHGMHIQTVEIEIDRGLIQSGIDTPEDLARAEAFLKQQGGGAE